jgi:hypothetical protein
MTVKSDRQGAVPLSDHFQLLPRRGLAGKDRLALILSQGIHVKPPYDSIYLRRSSGNQEGWKFFKDRWGKNAVIAPLYGFAIRDAVAQRIAKPHSGKPADLH